MTAGRGIVHCEMPQGTDEAHGLQLWVNLAKKDKMIDPAYQEMLDKDIPRSAKDGITIKVIAGEAFGEKVCCLDMFYAFTFELIVCLIIYNIILLITFSVMFFNQIWPS